MKSGAGHACKVPFGACAAVALSLTLSGALEASAAEGFSTAPMNYLSSAGPKAAEIATITWALLWQAIIVVVVITGLVLVGVLRRRSRWRDGDIVEEPVERPEGGLSWIAVGVGLSTLALIGSTVWTVTTLASINSPATKPPLTIEVRGKQWWWEARYVGPDPAQEFVTANEIHIPVGVPVAFKLTTADVIHSFWIPALGDKIDLIPNQVNQTWYQASRPGIYRGQCVEYCGKQHAHMGLIVIADPPEVFQAWRDDQIAPASAPTGEEAVRGERLFLQRCGACHTVRGTLAGGALGPDLTHLMSRTTIAAATLPNTLGHLSGWISNPQTIKPGARMPNLGLSGPDLASIRTYLLTLK